MKVHINYWLETSVTARSLCERSETLYANGGHTLSQHLSLISLRRCRYLAKSVIDCLQRIAQQEAEDVDLRANGFFNLAVAYVNGYGIASDLAKAAEFLLMAAGLRKAQILDCTLTFSRT
jgi:TPR repeat protein